MQVVSYIFCSSQAYFFVCKRTAYTLMHLAPTLQTTTIENVHSFQSGENGVYFVSVDNRNGGFVKVEKTDVVSMLHRCTPKFSSVSQCGRGKTLRKLQCRRQSKTRLIETV